MPSFGSDNPFGFDPLGVAGMGQGPVPASSSAIGYTYPAQMPQGMSFGQLSVATGAPPAAAAPPARLQGMFGRGVGGNPGLGFADKLGLIGDILTGNPSTQNRLQQQAEQAFRQQQEAVAQQRYADEQQRLNRAQIYNTGDGQIVSVDQNTGEVHELQGARPATPHAPEQQQLIDEWARRRAANPNDPTLPLLERSIRGYQFTEPVMDLRQRNAMDQIDARGAQARQTRGTPTYGNLHPHTPAGKPGMYSHVSDADLLAALGK